MRIALLEKECSCLYLNPGFSPQPTKFLPTLCRRMIPGIVDATPRVARMAASIASRVCGT